MLTAPLYAPVPTVCGARRDVTLHAADVTMTCRSGVSGCSGHSVVVVVDNCSEMTVELLRVVRWQNRSPTIWDFVSGHPFEVPAGTRRTFARPLWSDGLLSFEVTLVGNLTPLRAQARATNPALDAARAACRACGGHWGNHGMTGVLGCLCGAKDAGRACHSACECEGGCELRDGARVGRCRKYAGDKGCTCP